MRTEKEMEQIKILEECIKDYKIANTNDKAADKIKEKLEYSKRQYERAKNDYECFIGSTNYNSKLSIEELHKKYPSKIKIKRASTFLYFPALISLWMTIFDPANTPRIILFIISVICFAFAIRGSKSLKAYTEEEKDAIVKEYNEWATKKHGELKASVDKANEKLDSIKAESEEIFTMDDWYKKYKFMYEGPDAFIDYATSHTDDEQVYFGYESLRKIIDKFQSSENLSLRDCAKWEDAQCEAAYRKRLVAEAEAAAARRSSYDYNSDYSYYTPSYSYDSSAQDEANRAMKEAAEAQKKMADQQMEMMKKQEAEMRRKENQRQSIQRNIDSLSRQLQAREMDLAQLHRAYKPDQSSISFTEGSIGRLKAQIEAEKARLWSV